MNTGEGLQIVPLADVDLARVWEFFERTSDGDRTFFKEPVKEIETIQVWLSEPHTKRLVAVERDRVVGSVAIIRGVGWSKHVGELRVVVDPDHRRHGVGRALVHQALVTALRDGISKVSVEVVAEQTAVIHLFQELGFTAEAVLAGHVVDATGTVKDLNLDESQRCRGQVDARHHRSR